MPPTHTASAKMKKTAPAVRPNKTEDQPPEGSSAASKEAGAQDASGERGGRTAELVFCFVGLQASYLTWGYVQEKVMTTEYRTGKFPSAAFCVFSNRVLAIAIAAAIMVHKHGRMYIPAPMLAFLPCSLSNSLSSYAQYQALRYVSFQIQTLSKSTKVIPVMLLGRLVNKRSYSVTEYMEAVAISVGVSIFSLSERGGKSGGSAEAPLLGVFMLVLYLATDSFTSQWQSRVYADHPKVDQFQMMFVTNAWSIVLTLATLLASGEMWVTMNFIMENPAALLDNMAIALSSAVGQLFIFRTIWKFGPVVFTLIMTTRQMFSMVLSAIVFGHELGALAYVGAGIVFAALLLQLRRRAGSK